MLKNAKVQGLLVLALGGLLGYVAASGKVSSLLGADEEKNAVQVTGVLGSPGARLAASLWPASTWLLWPAGCADHGLLLVPEAETFGTNLES